MEKKDNKPSPKPQKPEVADKDKFQDSLNYPPSEDIYNKGKRGASILLISAKENPVEINNERELNEQNSRKICRVRI
jgi:hypothetical protein